MPPKIWIYVFPTSNSLKFLSRSLTEDRFFLLFVIVKTCRHWSHFLPTAVFSKIDVAELLEINIVKSSFYTFTIVCNRKFYY